MDHSSNDINVTASYHNTPDLHSGKGKVSFEDNESFRFLKKSSDKFRSEVTSPLPGNNGSHVSEKNNSQPKGLETFLKNHNKLYKSKNLVEKINLNVYNKSNDPSKELTINMQQNLEINDASPLTLSREQSPLDMHNNSVTSRENIENENINVDYNIDVKREIISSNSN